MTTFLEKLAERVKQSDSLLCVGLDPSPQLITGQGRTPAIAALNLNKRTIAATKDLACTYKPNIAFYEALGLPGFGVLTETLAIIPPDIPVILDAKRGDVGSTSEGYARFVFDVLGVDAVTVSPYLGGDALAPFLARPDKGVFILCRTSNPGARDLQDLITDGVPLYQRVAHLAHTWNANANVGLVMGATFPSEMAWARRQFPTTWFLVPGVGAQGGDLEAALAAGLDASGTGVLIAASRSIMGAADPRAAAATMRDAINAVRRQAPAVEVAADDVPTNWLAGHNRELALALHDAGCVQFGTFTLKSGQVSPIYIDLRRTVADPPLMRLVARAYAHLLTPLTFDRLAAIPYAGLPIGTAVSLEMNRPLIYPRQEVKSYGTGRAIEGEYALGDTVAVIDDVITNGATKIEALVPLTAAGLRVRDIVVLIDREQGGAAELAAHGLRLHAVFTLSTLMQLLAQAGRVNVDDQERVRRFLTEEGRGHG